MGGEAWAPTARAWLAAVVTEEDYSFANLQRVLQQLWIDVLRKDAQELVDGEPTVEQMARLRQLYERIDSHKAALSAIAG